ncbi:cytochrome P450 71A1-like [Corylus avellana]|uniref:cytochrome P450 71A1-like n=1 Tax=Corylus avellana TaxID=13451 RepID=UPI00286D4321|nr:cytochrome P450 71A1-like [Corylus avellana]
MALLPWLQQSWQGLQKIPFNPLLSVVFLISFLYVFKRTRIGNPTSPPSPPKLPIIGNLHQLGTLPHRSLQALSNKYGPLMLLSLGNAPTLVVSSAAMAREMMKTHDIIFSNRPKTTAANILLYGCKDVVFSPYGEYWRQARKISVLQLLSLKNVQSFQCVREEEVEVLINNIRDSCLKGAASINLSDMFMATSNNIASRCILGQKLEEENGKSRFGQLSRRTMVLLAAFCFGDFFPLLGWIDFLTGLIPSLKATFRELDTFCDQVIEEHKTEKSDDKQHKRHDFVDILLRLQKNGMLDFKLTKDNLKAILVDMFVGGTETTSTTLEWLMAELIRNPNIMKRAQEEVRRVVRKKSKIDVNDINQMDYLKCIIKETLRLHPPGPLSVPRETSASVKIGGYDIPPKTRVFVNLWAIQRDPTVWERPEKFLPERFKDNPIDFKGQDFEFIPFGGGRRGCPGLTFGVASLEIVVANILCWFDWKLPSADVQGKDLDMSEVNGLSVSKKIPLHLVPILHSP